jgi:hypothetical protein
VTRKGGTYVSAIDDPGCFSSSKRVGAHFGLTPKKFQSGKPTWGISARWAGLVSSGPIRWRQYVDHGQKSEPDGAQMDETWWTSCRSSSRTCAASSRSFSNRPKARRLPEGRCQPACGPGCRLVQPKLRFDQVLHGLEPDYDLHSENGRRDVVIEDQLRRRSLAARGVSASAPAWTASCFAAPAGLPAHQDGAIEIILEGGKNPAVSSLATNRTQEGLRNLFERESRLD